MNEIISNEVNALVEYANNLEEATLRDDYVFNYYLLKYFFYDGKPVQECWNDIHDSVVDGANDGGIDFIHYDDENEKIYICQAKYRDALSPTEVIEELNKMSNTVANFLSGNTGSYNSKVKAVLQNALDRQPDDATGNVEYAIFTTAAFDTATIYQKIENQQASYSKEMVNLYQEDDIIERVRETLNSINVVPHESVDIDRANNYLEYESSNAEGIIVNLSSKSLIKLYNSYADKGLFDLNIRKYIANKAVDSGINHTLEHDRDSFWFLNNGIIVACTDYYVDGNTVKIYDFSIVNGGQTTNLIGKYKGNNTQEFFIPCKIVRDKRENSSEVFFVKIAEATNSQKPILLRDLKSNSPEMKQLKKILKEKNIELEIKRGEKPTLAHPDYKIKNDELGQFILSFLFQKPGIARSGKKKIFENNDLYNNVFRVNYFSDIGKRAFLISAVDLIARTKLITEDLKKGQDLNELQKEILKNGTQIIYALLGTLYKLVNEDISKELLIQKPDNVADKTYIEYRSVLNDSYDELDDNLKRIIINLVKIVTDCYKEHSGNETLKITSVSNYFKTEKKYYELILDGFINRLDLMAGEEIMNKAYIFKQ